MKTCKPQGHMLPDKATYCTLCGPTVPAIAINGTKPITATTRGAWLELVATIERAADDINEARLQAHQAGSGSTSAKQLIETMRAKAEELKVRVG